MRKAKERYYNKLSPFFDTEEYCLDHEESECFTRKETVRSIKNKIEKRDKAEKSELDGRAMLDHFSPCDSTPPAYDCEHMWDEEKEEYVKRRLSDEAKEYIKESLAED